jgi:hypothetical protein
LAGLATIFAYSRSLNAELKGQGRASDLLLRLKPRGQMLSIIQENLTRTSRFLIQLVDSDRHSLDMRRESHSHFQRPPGLIGWWRPFSISILYMTLAVLARVALITVLEILQRKPDEDGGFANVGIQRSWSNALISSVSIHYGCRCLDL